MSQSKSNNNLIRITKQYAFNSNSASYRVLNTIPSFKSHFEVTIPYLDLVDEDIAYVEMSIPHVVITNSLYNINNTNDRLDVAFLNQNYSVVFDWGNYTIKDFIKLFKTVMDRETFPGWSLTISQTSGKFTVTHTSETFTLLETSTIKSVMGITQNISAFGTGPYTAHPDSLANLQSCPVIYLRCRELAHGCFQVDENNNSDIICSIPNNSNGFGGKIIYENRETKIRIDSTGLDRLTIQFTDFESNLLNFNGQDVQWLFEFNIFYNEPEVPKFTMKQLREFFLRGNL